VPNFSFGWRLMFVIGGLIASIGVIARFQLPESPRWLALHGRVAEADAVVRRMEAGAAAKGIALPEPRHTAALGRTARVPVPGACSQTLWPAPRAARRHVVLLVHRQLRVSGRRRDAHCRTRFCRRQLDPVPGCRRPRLSGGRAGNVIYRRPH